MDKVILKKFALYARDKIEEEIKREMGLIGITENGIENGQIIEEDILIRFENRELNKKELKQRKILIDKIEEETKNSEFKIVYESIVEEIAYTWFNRIIAIRFMEVNNYFDDEIRVLSSERKNDNEPQIIREPFNTDIKFSIEEKEKIFKLKEENKTEELFKLLFIKKCNKLNEILPELFEKIEDYTELFLPISIIDNEGVIFKLINEIPEEMFDISKEGQIEIIGWLYQYYNEEKKKIIDQYTKKNKKVIKEDLPAKTQLFTPKWIVKYLVQNSLGNIWIKGHKNEKLIENWKYYIKDDEKTEENLEEIYRSISIEDIKILDPCMGSGHILMVAFDTLLDIYLTQGYSEREAVQLILKNNLYGLDIDKRAYQLTYFALMMKGRQHYRRIFSKNIKLNIDYIKESNKMNKELIDFISDGDETLKIEVEKMYELFLEAKEYGSLIKIVNINYKIIEDRIEEIKNTSNYNLFENDKKEKVLDEFLPIIKNYKILLMKYDVVITNPPYLGTSMFNSKLSDYVKKNYKDSKFDLFSVFIEKCLELTKENGICSMITMHSWMFLSSYEKLREKILKFDILNMIHLGTKAFNEIGGEVVQTTAWNQRKSKIENLKGKYFRLVDIPGEKNKKIKYLEALKNKECGYFYEASKENFGKIPGMPIGYWASENLLKDFEKGIKAGDLIEPRQGLATADNDRFLRQWYEVVENRISYKTESTEESMDNGYKWYPYNKGGERRQWYGNYDYIVNWEKDGIEIKNFKDNKGKLRSRPQNTPYYFKEAVTWSLITSSGFSIRYREKGGIHDVSGMSAFNEDNRKLKYILGLMGTKISDYVFKMFNPTVNLQVGDFNNFPVIENEHIKPKVISIVDECIKISKYDWNTFETSWDLAVSPLANIERYIENYKHVEIGENGNTEHKKLDKTSVKTIKEAYNQYKIFTNNQFLKLKQNEEELNSIFIDIYGLQEEMTSDVSDRNITIAKIFDETSEIDEEIKGNSYVLTKADVVKQLISYAVGCMFGRYSLDEEGLVFAGGEFNREKYISYIPDMDNCIPITDSEYFSDDIVTKFVEFIKVVYGNDTLGENLEFIADSLGNKGGTPKEVIRNYFLKDFYNDHIKRYRKRPIYWLYESGKKDGFKALVYMHRYDEQTTAKVRISYLHELQKHYERRADFLKDEIENNSNRKMAEQELKKIKAQLDECKQFDEKMNHLSSEYISIDLDDGVKVNYIKVQTDRNGKVHEVLGKVR